MTGVLRRLWMGAFAFYLSFYLLLSALPLYATAIGVSERALGLIIGCFAIASMIVKPWAGWASDRFGRRPLLLAGAAIFLVASAAYGWSGGALALLVVRLLHGSGMGLFPTASSAVVADLAPADRRGEYIGHFGAAANIGMAIGPIAGMAVVDRAGFATLFGLSAAIAFTALAFATTIPETLRERHTAPLGVAAALSRAALFPSLVVLCLMVTYGAQIAFLPIYAHGHGINPGVFFLVFALVVAAVRGQAGRVSDRRGRAPVAAAGLALSAAALIALAGMQNLAGFTVAGALYGIGFGAAQPVLMAWCVDRVAPADRGRAMGTYFAALELGIAIGAVGAGLAVAAVGFAATFLTVGAVAAAGAVLALMGRTSAAAPA
ncbi:MAG: MFS transporter [Candidatus Rokubacteria bacterium]|nr:MFS transporter [Candidatus Rokubacteria bacterium]